MIQHTLCLQKSGFFWASFLVQKVALLVDLSYFFNGIWLRACTRADQPLRDTYVEIDPCPLLGISTDQKNCLMFDRVKTKEGFPTSPLP
jgi:hypothetical protein